MADTDSVEVTGPYADQVRYWVRFNELQAEYDDAMAHRDDDPEARRRVKDAKNDLARFRSEHRAARAGNGVTVAPDAADGDGTAKSPAAKRAARKTAAKPEED